MGRKRKGVPERLDPTKQQRLVWSLADMMAGPSSAGHRLQVVDDNHPCLAAEEAASNSVCPKRKYLLNLEQQAKRTEQQEIKKRDEAINKCDFYVEIHRKNPLSESDWHCHLGTFKITIPQPCRGSHTELPQALPPDTNLWFYVNSSRNEHLIYLESNDGNMENMVKLDETWTMYFQASCDMSYGSLEAISTCGKLLILKLDNYDPITGSLEVHILAAEGVLVQLQFSSDSPRLKKINSALQQVLSQTHRFPRIDYSGIALSKKHDIGEFYLAIRERHLQEDLEVDVNVQHANFRPRLRQYQKEAVIWMLHREKTNAAIKSGDDIIHQLYEEVHTVDGHTLYFNKHTGFLVKDKPKSAECPPGGILADEMGLGKTVEVLACIMCHRRTDLPSLEPLPVVTPQLQAVDSDDAETEAFLSEGKERGRDSNDGGLNIKSEEELVQQGDRYLNDSMDGQASITKNGADLSSCPDIAKESCSGGTVEEPSGSDRSSGDSSLPVLVALDHDYCGDSPVKPGETKDTIGTLPIEGAPNVKGKGKKGGKGKASGRCRAKNKVDSPDKTESSASDVKTLGKKARGRTKRGKSSECEKMDISTNQTSESTDQLDGMKTEDSESVKSEVKNEMTSDITDAQVDSTNNETKPKTKKKRPRVGYVEIEECESDQKDSSMLVKQKTVLECICGSNEQESDGQGGELRVACIKCGLKQHAACMKYDLTDPYRGEYMCPHCHVISPPKPSGATLIISPNSISHQWVEEIHKHIHKEKLKVFVYGGVHKHRYIQPQSLANHDIVITTYETLQKEINYVDLPHSNSEAGRRFRHPKRFMAVPSPIIAVEWWRICLDEAQMVECTTTRSAEMALRLSAINRWCVTGTPIQKGLDDLYGLLLFLGEAPYWVQPWWQRLLYMPYCYGNKTPMNDAIARVMWRTSKSDVLDQICLPTQSEEIHWLHFSPVEEHFYTRTFSRCARTGLTGLNKWQDGSIKLNSLDRYTLHALLGPLTRLRQACCHPQAVRGSYLPIQKSMMTMEEVLVSMTKKARQECEEAHRQLVAAMNGQAGLHIIKNNYVEAVGLYRDVLRSIDEQKDQFRTDPLQQLHTLHNLQEVLSQKPDGVSPTLRDDKLKEEATDLRAKYLLKAASFVTSAQEAWTPLRTALKEAKKELSGHEDWWADLLQWVLYMGTDELLVERIKTELLENRQMNNTTLAHSFRDIRGLEYVLEGELETLSSAHQALIDRINRLQDEPTPEMINQTVECCLRPDNPEKPLKTCVFCKTDELFDIFENKLFSFKDKGVTEVSGLEGESTFIVGTRRQGTWADSETERILKSIISFSKSYGGTPSSESRPGTKLVDIGNAHLKVFETLKKEFKVVRILWIELKAQVSAHDELDMATTRLRLRLPDEPVPDPPQPHILEPAEFDSQQMKLKSDIIIARNQLSRKMGQLVYLKNLAKAQTSMEGKENTEPCPICQRALGKKWAVFTCGHCFCLDCIRLLIDEYSLGGHIQRTKCPLCRQPTDHKDINYVSMVGEKQRETEIKGDLSTKVEGIVRCVLDILSGDKDTKILIFSLWQNVLSIIENGLRDNDVSFVSLTSNKFQKNLTDFKNLSCINVLLLPVQSGANGLNLIEATHLLLVEPILNPSQELQAIGRIHRIGQTRPTFVHRFLVRNTIEERLHHLLAVRSSNMTTTNNVDDTPFTINDLRSLFLESQQQHPDLDDEEDGIQVTDLNQEEQAPSLGQGTSNHGEVGQGSGNNDETGQSTDNHGEMGHGTSSHGEVGQSSGKNNQTGHGTSSHGEMEHGSRNHALVGQGETTEDGTTPVSVTPIDVTPLDVTPSYVTSNDRMPTDASLGGRKDLICNETSEDDYGTVSMETRSDIVPNQGTLQNNDNGTNSMETSCDFIPKPGTSGYNPITVLTEPKSDFIPHRGTSMDTVDSFPLDTEPKSETSDKHLNALFRTPERRIQSHDSCLEHKTTSIVNTFENNVSPSVSAKKKVRFDDLNTTPNNPVVNLSGEDGPSQATPLVGILDINAEGNTSSSGIQNNTKQNETNHSMRDIMSELD